MKIFEDISSKGYMCMIDFSSSYFFFFTLMAGDHFDFFMPPFSFYILIYKVHKKKIND